jgi:CheY-like chemotaxis protein
MAEQMGRASDPGRVVRIASPDAGRLGARRRRRFQESRPLLQFPALQPICTTVVSAHRVLVVDDDEGVRLTFSRVLKMDGYRVQVAATAEEALSEVEQERPDAILVDLKMPLINGVGFLYRLREDPANQDIAVGVITGAPVLDDATVNDLRALNAQIWFKPLSIEQIQRVAQILLTERDDSTGTDR